jgi:t-SNARE complex subunit (syntaxin)
MPVSDASFDRLERIVDRMDNDIADVRSDLSSAKLSIAVAVKGNEAVVDRLGRMESSIVWLTRTVAGAVILAIVAFLVRGGFNVPG